MIVLLVSVNKTCVRALGLKQANTKIGDPPQVAILQILLGSG